MFSSKNYILYYFVIITKYYIIYLFCCGNKNHENHNFCSKEDFWFYHICTWNKNYDFLYFCLGKNNYKKKQFWFHQTNPKSYSPCVQNKNYDFHNFCWRTKIIISMIFVTRTKMYIMFVWGVLTIGNSRYTVCTPQRILTILIVSLIWIGVKRTRKFCANQILKKEASKSRYQERKLKKWYVYIILLCFFLQIM